MNDFGIQATYREYATALQAVGIVSHHEAPLAERPLFNPLPMPDDGPVAADDYFDREDVAELRKFMFNTVVFPSKVTIADLATMIASAAALAKKTKKVTSLLAAVESAELAFRLSRKIVERDPELIKTANKRRAEVLKFQIPIIQARLLAEVEESAKAAKTVEEAMKAARKAMAADPEVPELDIVSLRETPEQAYIIHKHKLLSGCVVVDRARHEADEYARFAYYHVFRESECALKHEALKVLLAAAERLIDIKPDVALELASFVEIEAYKTNSASHSYGTPSEQLRQKLNSFVREAISSHAALKQQPPASPDRKKIIPFALVMAACS